MEGQPRRSSLMLVLLLLAAAVAGSSDWDYSQGEHGPEHWADHYPACGGSRQSPINITSKDALGNKPWPSLRFHNYDHVPDTMTITNNGHSVQVSSPDLVASISGGELSGEYIFSQFHLHWGKADLEEGSEHLVEGSEHLVDGQGSSSELHLVHFKGEYGSVQEALNHPDGLAVLGVMLQHHTQDNTNLDKVVAGLADVTEPGSTASIATFALQDVLPGNVDKFYRYDGSLTTPGCAEAVIWTVFKHPITVSSAQLKQFRTLNFPDGEPMVDNFRPVQPLNGRKVYIGV